MTSRSTDHPGRSDAVAARSAMLPQAAVTPSAQITQKRNPETAPLKKSSLSSMQL